MHKPILSLTRPREVCFERPSDCPERASLALTTMNLMLSSPELMEERLEGRTAGGGMRAVNSQYWECWRGRATFALVLCAMAPVIVCASATRAFADSARLTFDVLTLAFPSADPDLTAEIDALENPVSYP